MARRLLLACALALLLPAAAAAQGPDATPPVNTTPAPLPGWYGGDYAVALSATDEEGVTAMQWRVDGGEPQDALPGDTVTVAGDGVHQLFTRALDAAGNASEWREDTVRIDTSRPADLTDAGATGWRRGPVAVDVWAIDAVSDVDHVEWRLDGGATRPGPNGSRVTIEGDGTRLLETRAVDLAGNVSDWKPHELRLDSVPPVDETAVSGGWRTTSAAVAVTGSDAESSVRDVRYRLDGGATVTASHPATVTVTGDGEHVLHTQLVDAAGNASAFKAHAIRIDTTAPENRTAAPPTGWQGASVGVRVLGADGGSGLAGVQWELDGGAVTSGPPPLDVTVAGTGVHTLRTRAVDVAGNASGWRSDVIRIDTVLPVNTTSVPAGPITAPAEIAVTGTDADAGVAEVQWRVGNAGELHRGTPARFTEPGTYALQTRVVDAAGNATGWREDVVRVVYGAESDPPVDTTSVPPGWATSAVDVVIRGTDASGVAAVQWRRGGGAIQRADAASATVRLDTEGRHVLETRLVDSWGTASAWRRHTVRIDLTVPEDTTDVGSGWLRARSLVLAGTDAVSGPAAVEYALDGGAVRSVPAGTAIALPGDGPFVLERRVLDAAGQASAWVADTVRVDGDAPLNTAAVPAAGWRAEPLSLPLAGTDAVSGVDRLEWRLDGGDVRVGGPAVVDTEGSHTLETRVVDVAGNASPWRSDAVRVDLTAPRDDTPAAPGGWRATAYAVTVRGSDGAGSGVARVERRLDGDAVSTTAAVRVEGDGEHVLRTRVVDLVGRASAWRTQTIRIDSVAPAAGLACPGGWVRPPAACDVAGDGGPSGLASLTLDGQPVAPGPVAVAAEGERVLSLAAVDGAGNAGGATAVARVDGTAPVARLACEPARQGHACVASAADGLSGVAALHYRVDGGAWTAPAADGTFAVARGAVVVRAVDAAGNEAATPALALAPRERADAATRPVYLHGRTAPSALVGALRATRGAGGRLAADLRPLALGRGSYRIVLTLAAGGRERVVRRVVELGRGEASPRLRAALPRATGDATVALTVRRRAEDGWKPWAGSELRLPQVA